MKTLDEYFRDWETEAFGFGYGTGEPHVLAAVRKFMELCEEGRYKYDVLEKELGATVAWLLINALGREDIIEYGTSPRFGWLTTGGTKLREYMLSQSLDHLIAIACSQSDTSECAKKYCNCWVSEPGASYDENAVCLNPFWGR